MIALGEQERDRRSSNRGLFQANIQAFTFKDWGKSRWS